MNATQENAIAKLRAQQAKQPENSGPHYAANQLIGICQRESASAEILLPDLDNPEMDIVHAEKQIHAFADKIHKERGRVGLNCVCVSDADAEKILRQFYGLPPAPDAPEPSDDFTGLLNINPLDFL